ncbi:MAG: T9SS type A sorting domain-containing protein [Paludibacteraceae bacterium]|nr:T9SS type A sorting domain-containing protein [Paludibacteraceae bacterium]
MKKKILLMFVGMLCGMFAFASQASSVLVILADNSSVSYELAEVQNIVFDKTQDSPVALINLKTKEQVEGVRTLFFPKEEQGDQEDIPTDIIQDDEVKFYIFPSPVQSTLYIKGVAEDASVQIYNMAGQCVMQTNGTEIQVAEFVKGTYLLKVENKVVKFIKK